jgi:lipoprotein-anchoring transpeptidase ErfK/SrfK
MGLTAGLAVLLAVYLGLGIAFVQALPAPALDLGLPPGDQPLALDAAFTLETIGLGTTVQQVRLTELQLGENEQVVGERDVPIVYRPITEGRLPGETHGLLVSPDGGALFDLDARYTLQVQAEGKELTWLGPRGVPLTVERTFATARTARAQFASDPVLRFGEPLAIAWSEPVAEFEYTITPDVRSHSRLSEDGTTAYIELDEYQLNGRYEFQVTDARTRLGAPLLAPVAAAFTTPPALRVTGYAPTNGARDVAPGEDPIISFSAPVANPEAAEQAIVVDPPTDGKFRWLAPNRVQFVTDKGFPYSTNISLTVQPGPEGLRAADGGFLEDEAVLAYRTRVHKRIDINLSRQFVTLFEDDRVVFTTTASTGVRGAETPVGNFKIQYKMAKTRMRGTNPSGHTYDIPDVPWVMALYDDYALHGAPWRQAWGVPQSNGCVSMPTPAAKFVYDWAPAGTPVHIHY